MFGWATSPRRNMSDTVRARPDDDHAYRDTHSAMLFDFLGVMNGLRETYHSVNPLSVVT